MPNHQSPHRHALFIHNSRFLTLNYSHQTAFIRVIINFMTCKLSSFFLLHRRSVLTVYNCRSLDSPIERAIIRFSGFGSMLIPSTIALIGLCVFCAKSLQLTFHRASRIVLWRRRKGFRLTFGLNFTFSLYLALKCNKSFVVCSIFVAILHCTSIKAFENSYCAYNFFFIFTLFHFQGSSCCASRC